MNTDLSGEAANPRPRVLAVDDDAFTRAYIANVLDGAGIDVVAVDIDDALAILSDTQFDLVIADRSMPGVSGDEFLAMVRSDPTFDLTPFLFLTASDNVEDLIGGLDGGADDYITKPFRNDELIARVKNRLARIRSVRRRDDQVLVDVESFAFEVDRELSRASRGGRGGLLAVVDLPSLESVETMLGDRERRKVLETLAGAMRQAAEPIDLLGATRSGDLAILLPDVDLKTGARRLYAMAERAAGLTTEVAGFKIRPVPMIGFVEFERGGTLDSPTALNRAATASREAGSIQDLQPHRWQPPPRSKRRTDHHPSRELIQVAATMVLGLGLPFLVYRWFDQAGYDISWGVYIAVVVGLVTTAALIWTEGFYAASHPGAPGVAAAPEPPATAIICAYLPNEAGTIVETVEHFMKIDYQAGLQVILAYNTPRDLAVENELIEIADRYPNLLLVRVPNSNSKAQNLNAGMARATGEFVGIFDADHHPDLDAFHRAWRWLSNGYSAVQGHCLVRNGDVSFLARMVSVEFESIYAVSHPGRYLRDQFGVFGGSNGYWRTDALHLTRMRGSMLTEDIDASMRLLKAGGLIASDPLLISRELATTTAVQIWNQRLRWAQGWFQVSIRHVFKMLQLPHFTFRQKLGIFNLLLQREVYPWISLQIFPLAAFWILRGDALNRLVPIFVATTIFTASVGPGTVWFAYRLAHPDIKKHRSWFWQYLFFSLFIYTEVKNIIARVAQLKQAMGETSWRVTPRSADPADGIPTIPLQVTELAETGLSQTADSETDPVLAPAPSERHQNIVGEEPPQVKVDNRSRQRLYEPLGHDEADGDEGLMEQHAGSAAYRPRHLRSDCKPRSRQEDSSG
jgi:cellulose synthase/poly-beta-1,6-N-acetylglucosamine synthase-like glycosyltransferase/FixJ family two-component response regulator/GGDEF domain-containing protein